MYHAEIKWWIGLASAVGTALIVGVPGLPKVAITHPYDAYLLFATTIAAAVFAYLITPHGSSKDS